MDAGMKSTADGVQWNLDDLYGNTKDAALDGDLDKALQRAQAFEKA